MAEQLSSILVNVPANGEVSVNVTGAFLSVTEATSSDFDLALDDNTPWIVFDKGIRYALPVGQMFARVRFRDRSGSTNSLRVYYGDGVFDDNRVSIAGSIVLEVPSDLTSTADQAIPNITATQVLSVNLSRKIATVQNLGGTTIRVGDASVAVARGWAVGPGASWEYATTAAVYVYQDSGAALTIAANEVE